MKITYSKLITLWNAIIAIRNCNDRLPVVFEMHTSRFIRNAKPDVEKWNSSTEKERKELNAEQIDILISQFSINNLPEYMPPSHIEPGQPYESVLDILSPMLKDYQYEEDKVSGEQMNGMKEQPENGQKKMKVHKDPE